MLMLKEVLVSRTVLALPRSKLSNWTPRPPPLQQYKLKTAKSLHEIAVRVRIVRPEIYQKPPFRSNLWQVITTKYHD